MKYSTILGDFDRNVKLMIAVFAFSITCISTSAQHTSALFFSQNSVTRHIYNPALTVENIYVSVPMLGGFSMQFNSNLGMSSFLYPSSGKMLLFLDNSISTNEALAKFSDNNYFRTDLNIPIFNLGFPVKSGAFYSVGINNKLNIEFELPFEIFRLAKALENSTYEISNLNAFILTYNEIYYGYSKEINEKLKFGVKAKLLLGGAYLSANIHSMSLDLAEDAWRLTNHSEIYTAGITPKTNTFGRLVGWDYSINPMETTGVGIALDFGLTYKFSDKFTTYFSVSDFGFISWNKNESFLYATTGKVIEYNGFGDISVDDGNINAMGTQIENLIDDIEDIFMFYEEDGKKIPSQTLSTTFRLGADYMLFEDRLNLGILSTIVIGTNRAVSDVMLALNFSPIKMIAIGLGGSISTVGANLRTSLSINALPLNAFVAINMGSFSYARYAIPVDKMNFGVDFGLNIVLGRRK